MSACARRALLVLLFLCAGPAAALDCPPLEETAGAVADAGLRHTHGLLWEISRTGREPSYLFGTVHVSDPRITDLPEVVTDALDRSDIFVMEALLDGPEVFDFAREMFYTDGTRLSNLLSSTYYDRAAEILAKYGIPPAAVDSMKPWAAFLTMNMPPDTGIPLDMVLMGEAQARDIAVHGLESLAEQAAVFEVLDESQHVRMLKDSICYYDILQADMGDMIRLYLDRDLAGLFGYREKYHLHSDEMYQTFMQGILWDRNARMVKRMQSYLEQGNAFIAIGAMHLPGAKGVLSLLEQAGYRVKSIY